MRITGLASGLDMDQIMKESMKPYKIRVDQKIQKKEEVEVKQKLYREVIKDSREFYNKYFDLAGKDSLLLSKNYSTVNFNSTDEGAVSANGLAGAKSGNYKVSVDQIAKPASITIKEDDIKDTDKLTLKFGGGKTVEIDLANVDKSDNKEIVNKIKAAFPKADSDEFKIKYSEFSKGIVIETKDTGAKIDGKDNTFTIDVTTYKKGADGKVELGPSGIPTVEKQEIGKYKSTGEDCIAKITNSKGEVYDYTGTNNKLNLDGVEFSFNDKTNGGEVRLIGKADVTEAKEKIVNFVKDYNKLIEKLNTVVLEKRDRSFKPLTSEQKKEMSESEIKLWDEKVKKGQLSRDSDISRIANQMKRAMGALVDGVSTNLEKIGIKPNGDYKDKNGMFTIDESKLKAALEEDSEAVMNLFIASPKDKGLSDSEKYSKTGVLYRVKDILYKETVTVTASIIKKAGIEGSSTAYNNELSKTIAKHEKKIKEMEKDLARKEQLLYSKYSKLEVAMNKYNSQQSYLAQQMGGQ